MTAGWAEKLGRVSPDPRQAQEGLEAVIKASGLCSFYIDLSCRNTLKSPFPLLLPEAKSWGGLGRRLWERLIGFERLGICCGPNTTPPHFDSLFLPSSLPCPVLSPEAAEAPNSPPTVRRRDGSLSEGLRPPMMQVTLLDTTV